MEVGDMDIHGGTGSRKRVKLRKLTFVQCLNATKALGKCTRTTSRKDGRF